MTKLVPTLAELNGFQRVKNGVYSAEQDDRVFKYSDGERSEAQLYEILSSANDLSSHSTELQSAICDWPTEYHLSEARANLLRSFNFEGVSRVLELGCGCGAITRFLGEHEGLEVDSVEGSPVRASLAALRCRDLDNVNVLTANFNDLVLPENHYDLILFVGVTEYAGRFSDRESDHEALQDLLSLAHKASTEKGVTLVAIENRLGLKYLLGASEDHYAIPFMGLDDYPEATGIRTYSREEWQQEISKTEFSQHQFYFPFPDYKVPTVLVPEQCDDNEIKVALGEVRSRDYSRDFKLSADENRAWQGLAQAGNLVDHSNSFLILLGNSIESLARFGQPKVQTFSSSIPDYLGAQRSRSNETQSSKQQAIKQEQFNQLQTHADILEQKVAMMESSKGWRFLNAVRQLFGKKTV